MAETWHSVTTLGALRPDRPKGVRIGDCEIALVRMADGVFAVGNVCTHEYALLSEGECAGGRLECPLHLASFDIRTGRAMTDPAEIDLPTYDVRIEGEAVWVRLPARGGAA